ncbi:MAG: phenylacetate--CoA ligase, partial [Okeania sp. SIO2C2]|uniref:phenylacetate--CoA ligase family protein n=1 Tax=Okeania sp. SIO2C2 TaxID=2607787 RepID=UPI0013B9E2D5
MHYDALETRSAAERQADLTAKLIYQVALAKAKSPYFAEALKDLGEISSFDDLSKLPVLNKSDLPKLQSQNTPFAGLNAIAPHEMANIFRSPGPIWDAAGAIGREHDHWKTGRGLKAAGIGAGDIVLNCFSYHWTPAGRMFESGAHAVGAAVVPAGVGQTDLQVEAISQLGVTTYAGTPDFLQVILDKASEVGADVSSLAKALVSGGALFPAMRAKYQEQGIDVLQAYGTADVGIIAYEVPGEDGSLPQGMIINEDMIVELLDPVTREPVAEGDVGEVVVTN